MSEILLSINIVAHELGICRSSVYALCRKGELELIKVGGRSKIPVDSRDDFIARQKTRPVFGTAKRAV